MLHKRSPGTPIVNPTNSHSLELSRIHFLGSDTWNTYRKEDEKELEKLKIKTAKAVFVVADKNNNHSYLVSVKKARGGGHKKDGKWEFPGGRLNKHETVFKALQREVGEEDDSSILEEQILQVESESPESLCYKIVALEDGSRHAIFAFLLRETDYQKIKRFHTENDVNNHETYRFELIHKNRLEIEEKKNKKAWTPKSLRILRALRES